MEAIFCRGYSITLLKAFPKFAGTGKTGVQSNIGNGTGGISQFDGGLFQVVLLYILVNRGSIQFFKDLLEPGNRNVVGPGQIFDGGAAGGIRNEKIS